MGRYAAYRIAVFRTFMRVVCRNFAWRSYISMDSRYVSREDLQIRIPIHGRSLPQIRPRSSRPSHIGFLLGSFQPSRNTLSGCVSADSTRAGEAWAISAGRADIYFRLYADGNIRAPKQSWQPRSLRRNDYLEKPRWGRNEAHSATSDA